MFAFEMKRCLRVVALLGIGLGGIGMVCGTGLKAQTAEKPVAAAANPPRELAMQPLAVYCINPPDVLAIEMLKMVPPQPYRSAIYDVLEIKIPNALPDQPIDHFFIVEGDGTVNLGPAYGSVKVVGMTLDEAKQAILKKLAEVLTKPEGSVQLAKMEAAQPVTNQYVVAADGRINLRKYGTVSVMGKTIDEARQAIEKHLAKFFVSPEVSVNVQGYNSQVYYVITDGAGLGDNVRRIPITGNETVLDAVAAVGGLSQLSSKKMWIARPAVANAEKGTVLNVDYEGITQRGATATNYQILPGDRLFIAGDEVIAKNNNLGKKTAPIERALGLLSLESSTFRMRGDVQAAPGEAAKQSQKQNSKAEKIDAELTDALYRYLESLIPLLEKP
jgi:polysaccharide biosynthesis/export protein